MKYLVLLLVIVAVLWLARSRPRAARPPHPADQGGSKPQAMIECAHCGVHLPRAEAVAGTQGLYCSEAHRLAHGDSR
ncbi:PP0621 family protein [Methylibium sp.]|uniref:PP0621 family protein n=1 Tax=Methylibium sp. TaxID=2067992 RepID=UPI003D0A45C1